METPTASTARLARVLGFEYRVLLQRAHNHPATHVIWRALAELAPPATILIVSASQADADVLELILERLRLPGVHPLKGVLADGRGGLRTHAGPRILTAIGERG